MGMSKNNVTASIWNIDAKNDNGQFYSFDSLSDIDQHLLNMKYRKHKQQYQL